MKNYCFINITCKQVLFLLMCVTHLSLNAQSFNEVKLSAISTGADHTLAIDVNGKLWAWGLNVNGQVGDNSNLFFGTPIPIASTIKFIAISAGYRHSLAIDEYGKLYQWGYCYAGSPGSENWENVNEPTILRPDKTFTKISAGWYFNLAIDTNGFLYAWGDNTYGQTGLGSGIIASTTPTKVFDSRSFVEISAGGFHSLLIDDAGRLWGMGHNNDGQLGNGSNSDVFDPVQISSTYIYTKISAGFNHSILLTSSGAIYTCGSNQYGQMGISSITTSNLFLPLAPVGASVKFSNICAGWNNSFAVSINNETYAWGVNSFGQLGCNNQDNQPLPIQIMIGTKGKLMDAKSYHTLAIDSYGYLWGWGYNVNGQLGDPSIEYTLVPRILNGPLSKVVTATAGNLSSLLNDIDKQTIKTLTISGTIDARDFAYMRDSLEMLSVLDIKATTITMFNGEGGTVTGNFFYPNNELPIYAFYNGESRISKNSLTEVVLPNTIKSIGSTAFYYCAKLQKITFSSPSVLTHIHSYAFGGCSSLENVMLPSTIQFLGDGAFYYNNQSSITVPASVTFIGNQAFALIHNAINVDASNPNYSSLDGVLYSKDKKIIMQCPIEKAGVFTIPSSVETIDKAAFIWCQNLTSINNSPNLKAIDIYAFYMCKGLTSYTIPNSITEIKGYMFSGCSGLLSITIPQTITSIGNNAFYGCAKLPEITIPSSVNTIAFSAFGYCNALSKIYALPITPVDLSGSGGVFYNINKSSCVLYVPNGKKTAYQNAVEWRDFQFIEEMSPTAINHANKTTLSATSSNHQIVIMGVDVGSDITIYNTQGDAVYKHIALDSRHEVKMLNSGIYLVKVGLHVIKVVVK